MACPEGVGIHPNGLILLQSKITRETANRLRFQQMSTSTVAAAIMGELDALVAMGERVVRLASNADEALAGEQLSTLMTWVSRSGHIIRKVAGETSAHEQMYQAALREDEFNYIHSSHSAHISQIFGAVKALQHDAQTGLLVDLRKLVQADIFADFLDMAEHLLHEGYKDAAAVITGGVLEDSLRKLADERGLARTAPSGKALTIDPLNVSLAKAGAYQSLTQKQITTWADVRNKAAHGEYAKYTGEDVKQMLFFVQRFCAEHLQ